MNGQRAKLSATKLQMMMIIELKNEQNIHSIEALIIKISKISIAMMCSRLKCISDESKDEKEDDDHERE